MSQVSVKDTCKHRAESQRERSTRGQGDSRPTCHCRPGPCLLPTYRTPGASWPTAAPHQRTGLHAAGIRGQASVNVRPRVSRHTGGAVRFRVFNFNPVFMLFHREVTASPPSLALLSWRVPRGGLVPAEGLSHGRGGVGGATGRAFSWRLGCLGSERDWNVESSQQLRSQQLKSCQG